MNRLLFILYISLFPLILSAQPKREVRAAWVTTAYGLDWPHSKATSPASIRKQQRELEQILDQLKEANFNTVIFQTRMRGDVAYRSEIEPYSAIFTGTSGQAPGYDPLTFAVNECHKRGMECHAWMVAIPLGNKKHVESLGKASVTRRKRDICVAYKNEYFLNPGHPATKEYLMKLVREVVTRYDVDGVQFDYLRYPEYAPKFPDDYDFRRYGKGRTKEQWRRDNLTDIVRYLYHGIKAIKPWVKVSTCPVGKYKDTARYPSRGWNAYNTVSQDPQGWLGEGIMDQIYPMLYFRGNNFYPFALDWQEQNNSRHIVPGLGIYFLDPREGKWTIGDVERQINFVRKEDMAGVAYYRVKYLVDNVQGLYDELKCHYYDAPALVPAMPWLDKVAPSAPSDLKVERTDGYTRLTWGAATDNDKRNAPRYVVYASDSTPVDISDPHNIVAHNVIGTEYLYAPLYPWQSRKYFAVTAIDRYGNESEAVQ
jgi:uncharacterized lipoprotein YddW (UPF0748 family)